MELIFKGTPISFHSNGTGNPLILLHGFLESSNIWKPYFEGLSKNRQVITIDLPGHGNSGVIEEILLWNSLQKW